MNKTTLYNVLCTVFAPGHVQAYLSKFPDNHTFPPKQQAIADFIDYINALPAPGVLPEEQYDY